MDGAFPLARRAVRVGVVGVGNCASSFVQGLAYYAQAGGNEPIPGLMHADLGGYGVGDVKVVSAFDIARGKVGMDVSEAIFAPPNNTHVFARPGNLGVVVRRGPTLDGVGKYMTHDVIETDDHAVDVAEELRSSGTEVLVSYLPVGSQKATEFYAEQALAAGCAFVNCVPVFIGSDSGWRRRFEEAGLPIVGDDIKSQVGATIVHRLLANLFRERGVRLDRTYQLNVGGNADFQNMLERERLESKKISKTQAVTSQFDVPLPAGDVHVGPSDFVPWLTDRKFAFIRLEGTTFGGVPLNLELKLEVWDSPNSAGVVIDAVRCAKIGLDRGIGGSLEGPSAYFMKSPAKQFTDDEARLMVEAFAEGACVTTTFHLVRHGSHGRLDRVLCGRMEGVGLSEAGQAEVAAVAARLRREAPAALYSSPLQRCRESAEAVAAMLGLPVEEDAGLLEVDFGDWTGRTFNELRADPRWAAWNAHRSLHRAPGGESMDEAQMRAVRCVEAIAERHAEAAVVLVTHSDIVKALACHWLGLSLDFYSRFEVSPASLTTAVVGDWGAKLVRLNEEPRP